MVMERTSILPDKVEFKSASGREEVLVRDRSTKMLCGLSPKAIYRPLQGRGLFFGKLNKPRETAELFADSVSHENLTSPRNSAGLEAHKELLGTRDAFLDVLASRVANAIFNKAPPCSEDSPFMAVPDNLFLRCSLANETTSADERKYFPFVLSRGIFEFDEFLTRAVPVQDKLKPSDHTKEIKKVDLQLIDPKTGIVVPLSIDKAIVLGKLYGIALLMGHWDILNNINLSNSGAKEDKNGNLIPAIVDWGNCLGAGLKGLPKDQICFRNPDIFQRAKHDLKGRGIEGLEHTVPFDGVVYPLLPRQLVDDLFDMSGSDPISRAVFEGFESACKQAEKALVHLDDLIHGATVEALYEHTNAVDAEYVNSELLPSFYLPDQKSDYTLAKIMRERIHSLREIIEQLKSGVPLQEIAKRRLETIINSQKGLIKGLGLFESNSNGAISSLGDSPKLNSLKNGQ